MSGGLTVERLIQELGHRPKLTARELCRKIHGSYDGKIKGQINRLLYNNKQSIFLMDDSQKGAPKWTVVDRKMTTLRTNPDGKPICSHCRTIILEGEETRHLHGMCRAFYSS